MNQQPSSRSTRPISALFVMLIVLCAISAAPSISMAQTSQPNPDQSQIIQSSDPFLTLANIPAMVDAAAVLNNPADHFLLNNSGRFTRKLLSFAGVFTHTEHAFDALSKAFNAQTDDTIRALLSGRVVVVWDEIGSTPSGTNPYSSFFNLTNSIDTHWTIVCEVDPQYLDQLRTHLKPVRRRIEQGQAVYAIEKGRYEIVLLSNELTNADQASVILAPKSGSSLLNHVLASIVTQSHAPNNPANKRPNGPSHQSILQGREQLIATLATPDDWSIAWIVQLDRFNQSQADPSPDQQTHNQPPAIVGVITTPKQSITLNFASDLKINLPTQDAPVGLLSAIGGDSIMGIAMAKTPSVFVYDDLANTLAKLISIDPKPTFPESSTDQPDQSDHGPIGFPSGPGLIMLSAVSESRDADLNAQNRSRPIAMTILTQLDHTQPTQHANESLPAHVDNMMRALFQSYGQASPPNFQGRFPNAIRTYTIEHKSTNSASTLEQSGSPKPWLSDFAKLSWLTTDLSSTPIMITALTSESSDATKQIRWIAEAAKKLDSIPNQSSTGVITSGFIRPAKAIASFDSNATMDLAISKLIDEIRWKISRAPVGFSGSCSLAFADLGNITKLGNDGFE